MSRPDTVDPTATGSFPRVSGDEPFEKHLEHPVTLFSPRERG